MSPTTGTASVTGQVLDSTLLVSALGAGPLADVTRDSLLLAQRNKPTAKTVPAWLSSYDACLTQVGWLGSGMFSSSSQLAPGPAQKVPETVPWHTMRVELGNILQGSVSLSTVDEFVHGLDRLSGDALSRWTAATILGTSAVMGVAVAAPSTGGARIAVLTGWLTYGEGAAPPHLTAFPDAAVPAIGATLSVAGSVYNLSTETAERNHDQLDALVAAVLPDIPTVHPLT